MAKDRYEIRQGSSGNYHIYDFKILDLVKKDNVWFLSKDYDFIYAYWKELMKDEPKLP